MLWFNCELKIETGNERHKSKMPHQFTIFNLTFQNKIPCIFLFFKRGKRTYVKNTRGVQYKNTKGVQYKNTRGVQCKNTRGVQCKNTRGV